MFQLVCARACAMVSLVGALVFSSGWCWAGNAVTKEQPIPSSVRFDLDLTLGSWMTDRAYQTSTDAFDVTFDGLVRMHLTGRSWGLYYKGGWSAYLLDNTLTSHNHQLTTEKRFALPFLRGSLAMGASFVWEDYADYFTAYDRLRPEAYMGLKLYAGNNSSLRLLSTVGYAAYLHSNEYSHLYHTLSLQGTAWFSSRTTIRLQADWTYKAYLDDSAEDAGLIDPDVDDSHQLQLYLRIAQSLGRQAALRVWGKWLPKINQMYRFNDTRSTTLSQNLSDDLNVVDGGSGGLELEFRPKILRGLRLTLLGNVGFRHFGGHAARDSSGNLLISNAEREDMTWNLGVQLTWRLPFDISGFWGNGIYIKASYHYRINTSNDTNFTFNQHLAYLGLGTRW